MQKALFLDRDGVININHGYVYQKDNFDWIDGIFELIIAANAAGYLVIVVTNQSGIGRGLYSEDDFASLTQWMLDEAKRRNAIIDDVFYCPYHPTSAQGKYLKYSDCRKPKAGMLIEAANKWQIDLSKSVMIGDKFSDIECAMAACLAKAYLYTPELREQAQETVYSELEERLALLRQVNSATRLKFIAALSSSILSSQ